MAVDFTNADDMRRLLHQIKAEEILPTLSEEDRARIRRGELPIHLGVGQCWKEGYSPHWLWVALHVLLMKPEPRPE